MNEKVPAVIAGDPIVGTSATLVYVFGLIAFAAVLALFFLIRYFWDARTRPMIGRLASVRSAQETATLRTRQPSGGRDRLDDAFSQLLQQTGLKLTPDQAVGWIILVGCVVGVAGFFIAGDLWPIPVGFALGACAVLATFIVYRSFYRNRLQAQLPDAIAFLARALRSGLSLEQAILMVGTESPKPLADEFDDCAARIRLGSSINAALEAMARRLRTIDFNALVSTIAVYQSNGGNLPLLLDRLEASARDRANFRAYFLAATALSRISIIPIALLVPVLVIVFLVWQPGFVGPYLATPAAPFVIGSAILIECIGLYWIYWLLRFDY